MVVDLTLPNQQELEGDESPLAKSWHCDSLAYALDNPALVNLTSRHHHGLKIDELPLAAFPTHEAFLHSVDNSHHHHNQELRIDEVPPTTYFAPEEDAISSTQCWVVGDHYATFSIPFKLSHMEQIEVSTNHMTIGFFVVLVFALVWRSASPARVTDPDGRRGDRDEVVVSDAGAHRRPAGGGANRQGDGCICCPRPWRGNLSNLRVSTSSARRSQRLWRSSAPRDPTPRAGPQRRQHPPRSSKSSARQHEGGGNRNASVASRPSAAAATTNTSGERHFKGNASAAGRSSVAAATTSTSGRRQVDRNASVARRSSVAAATTSTSGQRHAQNQEPHSSDQVYEVKGFLDYRNNAKSGAMELRVEWKPFVGQSGCTTTWEPTWEPCDLIEQTMAHEVAEFLRMKGVPRRSQRKRPSPTNASASTQKRDKSD